MGFLGLGKNDKSTIVKGAVDLATGIRGMIDDSKLTDEEKVRYNAQMNENIMQFAKDTMAENTDRSIARRQIAVFLVYFYSVLVVALMVLWKFDVEWFKAAKEMLVTFWFPEAFLAVITFFFGAHIVRGWPSSQKSKK